MTQNLSTLIKPAAPSPATVQLIDGNARNWAHTTLLILWDHYMQTIENEVEKQTQLTTPDLKEPFQLASVWTRRNLGSRWLLETLEQTEAVIVAKLTDLTSTAATDSLPVTFTLCQLINMTRRCTAGPETTQGRTPSPPQPVAATRPQPTTTSTAAQVRACPSQI